MKAKTGQGEKFMNTLQLICMRAAVLCSLDPLKSEIPFPIDVS